MENKGLFKNKWFQVIAGVILLAFGIATMVLAISQPNEVYKPIAVVLAVCLFITGLVSLIIGFVQDFNKVFSVGIIIGTSIIAIGVVLCVRPQILNEVIIVFAGTLLIVVAVAECLKSILLIINKGKVLHIVFGFIIFVVGLILGIVTLVYHTRGDPNVEKAIYIIIGVIFAISGLLDIIFGIIALTKQAKAKKEHKGEEPVVVVDRKEIEDKKSK